MKLNVFLSASFSFLLSVLVTIQAWAMQPEPHPYYGYEFYHQQQYKLRDTELKETLKKILISGHKKTSVMEQDEIVKNCDATKNCTMQTSLGYDKAREFLLGKYYLVFDGKSYGIKEKYCDRVYTEQDFKNGVGKPAPGLVPDNTVINIEHTWPQSKFSGKHPSGLQKADLHHLFPTDSAMNSLRGNINFGEVINDKHKVKCTASKYGTGTNTNHDVFEPPQNHKGQVARALFYFSIRYDLAISPSEEKILKQWHIQNPVTDEEMNRNNSIYELQNNRNPFIDHPELVDQVSDF